MTIRHFFVIFSSFFGHFLVIFSSFFGHFFFGRKTAKKRPQNDRLVIGGGFRGAGGGEWEDPLRSLRKLVLKKFSLCQVRFFGAIFGSELAFFGARCLVNAFWCLFAYVLA